MNRFNYLSEPRRMPARIALVIDNRLRGPLGLLASSFVAIGIIAVIGFARLHAEERATSALRAQLAVEAVSLASLERERDRVAMLTNVTAHVGALRRASLQRANQLAWIGNRLPVDLELHALRFADGRYSLDGTSRRVASIGSALLALRDVRNGTTPHLITLRADTGTPQPSVHYELRLDAAP